MDPQFVKTTAECGIIHKHTKYTKHAKQTILTVYYRHLYAILWITFTLKEILLRSRSS